MLTMIFLDWLVPANRRARARRYLYLLVYAPQESSRPVLRDEGILIEF